MDKKQSSVEQIWEELDNLIPFKDNATAQKFSDILDKYKAMHKEEVESAYMSGAYDKATVFEEATNYYNETFE